MRTSELRSLPEDELRQSLEDLLDELANLRIQKATHQMVNPSRMKVVKRDIARHKTILNEYRLELSSPNLEK